MKKRKFCILSVLVVLALALSACIFESDDNGLQSWLSDQGMPSNYGVQALSVNGIKVASAETFLDTFPRSADTRAVLGHMSNLSHDLVLDIAFRPDTTFAKKLAESDSAGALLSMFWLRPFYTSKYYPSDSLPVEEEVNMNVSWKLDISEDKDFLDSIQDIEDSVWYKSLVDWNADGSADTVFTVKMDSGDTSAVLPLPSALVSSLQKIKGSAHLQVRLSAPKAKHLFRFYGDGTSYPPLFGLSSDSVTFLSPAPTPFRMVNIVKNEENCAECPVLHGGVYDSLVVELPSEPILKALSEFYGDDFPYTVGDSNDVRQTVIHAQLTMSRDDSKGTSELGQPIQVVVGSFVDSADLVIRRMESYRLNKDVILESGHPNLVFHDGDSLTLQLTYGVRDFVNKASDGRTVKFIMRLGYPFLQEKDTTYANYKTASGDSSYVFLSYFDYARYDFSTAMESPMTLKMWLASKRGDEE